MWRSLLLVGFLAGAQAAHRFQISWEGRVGEKWHISPMRPWKKLDNSPQELTVRNVFDRNEVPSCTTNQDKTISCRENGNENGMPWCLEALRKGSQRAHVVRFNRCTGSPAQRWIWPRRGPIQLEGTKECIHVNDHGGLRRAVVELRECADKASEMFSLEDAASSSWVSLQRPASSMMNIGVAVLMAALSIVAFLCRWQKEARVIPLSEGSAYLDMEQGGICLTDPTAMPLRDVPLSAGTTLITPQIMASGRPRRCHFIKMLMKAPSEAKPAEHDKIAMKAPSEGGQLTNPAELQPLVVVLDLDECLVHSCLSPHDALDEWLDVPPKYNVMKVNIPTFGTIQVARRKNLGKFLQACCAKYETYVFTAGSQGYAEPVLDKLDPKRKLAGRLYRDDCTTLGRDVSKNLEKVASRCGRSGDFSRIVLVDNSPANFAFQPRNGIPVPRFEPPAFEDDPDEDVLMKVLDTLHDLSEHHEDVRDRLHELHRVETYKEVASIRARHGLMSGDEVVQRWLLPGLHRLWAWFRQIPAAEAAAKTQEKNIATVSEIRVRAADRIDQISFIYSNGSIEKWGDEGGFEQDAFVLHKGEYITKIAQRAGDAMDMVQFFTNMGRVSPQYGNSRAGSPRLKYVASAGKQIIRLRRKDGYLQGISHVAEAPAPVIHVEEARPGEFKATFSPGRLGIEVEYSTGTVLGVRDGGQAQRNGVQSGMVIRKIDGRPHSGKVPDEKINGSEDYEITFDKAEREILTTDTNLDGRDAAAGKSQRGDHEVCQPRPPRPLCQMLETC